MKHALLIATLVVAGACASLGQFGALVQAPRFEEAANQPAEIRLFPPSASHPLGGAGVRIWTQVTNPNPFSFTLSTLRGTLLLEEADAAAIDLPLGLPLASRGETVFPIDVTIGFAQLPSLAPVIRRAAGGQAIAYRLEGTIGVEAGRFGTPTFGPMTLLRGQVR
jgi:hypothetical protein